MYSMAFSKSLLTLPGSILLTEIRQNGPRGVHHPEDIGGKLPFDASSDEKQPTPLVEDQTMKIWNV